MFNPMPMQQPAQRPMPPQAPPQQLAAGGSNFTMNEVPDLTAKLSMLPSSSLQQFAQLHKSDPYIMALVMSESNRRKKLQQAGMQPQGEAPKVVDQVIAGLAPAQQRLPEEQGIAQIPAPNMAHMADGGIAGYADGGVPEGALIIGNSYQDPETGVMKPLPESDALPFGNVQQRPKGPGPRSLWDMYTEAFMSKDRITERDKKRLREMDKNYQNSPETVATPQTQQGTMPGPNYTRGDSRFTAEGKPLTPVSAPLGERQAAAAPTAPRVAPTSVPMPEAMSPTDALKAAQQFVEPSGGQLKADLLARQSRVKQENEQNLTDYQKGLAALPEAYKGYEERLKAQEAGAAQEKEDAKGMAIFKAGLAMMAGSSPNALQNIGKGAMVGVEDYQGVLKDFKKAALERDKAFADIENARLAYKRDDMKTAQALKDRGQDRLDRVDDKMGDIAAKMFETTTTIGSSIYANGIKDLHDAQREQARLQSNERIANATNETHMRAARAHDPLALYRELGGGDPKKGFDYYTSATSEGRGDQAILAAYAKDPNALAMLKDTNPTLYNMVVMRLNAQMMPGTVSAPAAGQVRAP